MKIITITGNVGHAATGIVTESLLLGLIAKGIDLKIFAEKNTSHHFDDKSINTNSFFRIINKEIITKAAVAFLKYPFNEILWILSSLRVLLKINKKEPSTLILVIASAGDMHLLELARLLSMKTHLPLYIHMTDPSPAPIMWKEKSYLRNGLRSIVKRCYKKASLFSNSNPFMLNYQLKELGDVKNPKAFFIYNPIIGSPVFKNNNQKNVTILYLGNILYNRRADEIIKAYVELISDYNNLKLQFVGIKSPSLNHLNIEEDKLKTISVHSWTNNPEDFIRNASILLDFDAPFENDVFISSKLMKYLNTDVPIVLITPSNSPSQHLCKELPKSVFISDYQRINIKDTLKKAIVSLKKTDSKEILEERKNLVASLSVDSAATIMVNKMQELIK
jgi:glycosyltransferase involved in cell wall biosynthesis